MLAKSGKFLRILFALFALAFAFSPGGVQAATNQLLLLVPDTLTLPDSRVSAWLDSAQEEGLQIKVMTDSQFMAAGASLSQYPGLILPDQVHTTASDTLVTAIQNYALNGGKVMLVYDFGVLNSAGFYVSPKSRFSSMVGVDYVLYDQYGGNMIGLGNVTGMSSWLRTLQVPPGKSMAWTTASSSTTTATALASTSTSGTSTNTSSGSAQFLAASPSNPGGLANYNHDAWFMYTTPPTGSGVLNQTTPKLTGTVTGKLKKTTTYTANSLLSTSTGKTANTLASTLATTSDTLEGISGYVYGFLTYPSFVTQGTYTGTTILTSPTFGLVSGYNTYGNGGVLFVNLPLAYLDGQTDGMLIHGYLHYFGTQMLNLPSLSPLPKAMAGLVFNWHFCAGDQIQPALQLKSLGVWNNGPFSLVITAGPDEATFGDGNGVNLANNPTAQNLVKYFLTKGHRVGSHGGWIHDYWGGECERNEREHVHAIPRDEPSGRPGRDRPAGRRIRGAGRQHADLVGQLARKQQLQRLLLHRPHRLGTDPRIPQRRAAEPRPVGLPRDAVRQVRDVRGVPAIRGADGRRQQLVRIPDELRRREPHEPADLCASAGRVVLHVDVVRDLLASQYAETDGSVQVVHDE